MAQDMVTTVIDFTQHITDHTRDFTGRGWVFKDINDWVAQAVGPRFFILTGEPGSGKTAIAGRLYQFSQKQVAPPDGLLSLGPKFLSAAHFCARDHRLIDPFVFAGSLATQLANRYPVYLQILQDKLQGKRGGRQSSFTLVKQDVGINIGGQVIGTVVNVGGRSPIDAFNHVVREPLEALCQIPNFREQIVILVEALDEALLKEEEYDIVSLLSHMDYLSPGVRFIVTTRPESDVLRPLQGSLPEPVLCSLTSKTGVNRSLADVKEYVLSVLHKPPPLADKLTANLSPEAFATAVQAKSDGNFLYVDYLLQMLHTQQGEISQVALDTLPKGLDKTYIAFLERLVGKGSWQKYARVLGTLAVVQEAVTVEQLAHFVSREEDSVQGMLQTIRQFLEVDDTLPASERTYAIYHRSFADFLLSQDRAEEYWCKEAKQHLGIAQYYMKEYMEKDRAGGWGVCDDYGLLYTATHLAKAASRQPQWQERVESLVRLVLDDDFQQARLLDLTGLQRDLELTLRTASAYNPPLTIPLVVETSQALVAFLRERLRPEQVFDLARAGDIKAAEGQLRLLAIDFAIDMEWQQVVLLTVAWLASKHNSADAQALCNRIAGELSNFDELPLLLSRVQATLNGSDMSLIPLPPLPPAPSSQEARDIVATIGGVGDEYILSHSGITSMAQTAEVLLLNEPLVEVSETTPGSSQGQERAIYVADQDTPYLVAYAVANPTEGTEFVEHYLAIHAANTYVFYRNRSLWGMLGAVLRHPDSDWILDILPDIEAAALAGRNQEFQEGFPLTLLALQALAGQADAERTLVERRQQIQADATQVSSQPEFHDWWGFQKRRLAALAQAYALLQDQDDIAVNMLTQALNLPFAYAGFQAPACLLLAEAIQVCQVGDRVSVEDALRAAQNAAHNIQDPTFCARATARVYAIRKRWMESRSPGFDIAKVVENFVRDPNAPEFTALHRVGEQYESRYSGPNKLPLPDLMRKADTLKTLAQVYRRPLLEFQQLNREQRWASDQQLPTETWVNVPDPDFAPLLAARLAAEVLATSSLSAATQAQLIQSLVSIASSNPTALDTVLARLLLAAKPRDPSMLKRLALTAAQYAVAEKPSDTLSR